MGVYLWANTDRVSPVELRASAAAALESSVLQSGEQQEMPAVDQSPCVRLSGVPRPQWANLAMLEQIKQRNRAQEAAKEKPEAPFFLPMLPGLEPKFVEPQAAENGAEGWEGASGAWVDDDSAEEEEEEDEVVGAPDDSTGQARKRKGPSADVRGPSSGFIKLVHKGVTNRDFGCRCRSSYAST